MHQPTPLPSLFILSLPRSLSSEVHRACCSSLDLRGPSWTTDGEIMNLDRFVLQGVQSNAFPKFILPRHRDLFARASEFLAHTHVADGFCYKDVVQPFIVSAWLARQPAGPVLKIRPNIAHVALAMQRRSWLYPTVASRQSGDMPAMMVEGLLIAEAALDGVPGETVAYDDLLRDFSILDDALARLYPGVALAPVERPDDFERRRDEVLARRDTAPFEAFRSVERELRSRWAEVAGPAPGAAATAAFAN